ncbi:lipoprotein [Haemophilus influenzae]|uniref:Lipoprotein n=1 Tax=Haemophilus influenzae TaxID=727 RepID=A0A2X1PLK5_HAEIF|nr:lipoprotein [Haemophilus influenzae]
MKLLSMTFLVPFVFKLRPAVPERATGEKPKVETTTTTTTTTEIIEE